MSKKPTNFCMESNILNKQTKGQIAKTRQLRQSEDERIAAMVARKRASGEWKEPEENQALHSRDLLDFPLFANDLF